jgi:hypothetical protein
MSWRERHRIRQNRKETQKEIPPSPLVWDLSDSHVSVSLDVAVSVERIEVTIIVTVRSVDIDQDHIVEFLAVVVLRVLTVPWNI